MRAKFLNRRLALAHDDEVHLGFIAQDLARLDRRVSTAPDDLHVRIELAGNLIDIYGRPVARRQDGDPNDIGVEAANRIADLLPNGVIGLAEVFDVFVVLVQEGRMVVRYDLVLLRIFDVVDAAVKADLLERRGHVAQPEREIEVVHPLEPLERWVDEQDLPHTARRFGHGDRGRALPAHL